MTRANTLGKSNRLALFIKTRGNSDWTGKSNTGNIDRKPLIMSTHAPRHNPANDVRITERSSSHSKPVRLLTIKKKE
jgi:hypothetical protein